MFPILKIGIKIYNYEGKFKGYSNLLLIYKNKVKNAKKDIEATTYGIFQYKVIPYKDGYKMNKNQILYKSVH